MVTVIVSAACAVTLMPTIQPKTKTAVKIALRVFFILDTSPYLF
jgi:hypothetical protein